MAKNSQKNSTNQRALQPNASAYQRPVAATGNPGEPLSTWQSPQNAARARMAEASICNALGAGWGAVGSGGSGLPPGIGPIPAGATGVAPSRGKKGK